MADLEKTVSILFKGVDEVSGTMDTIGGSLSNLGSSLESATQPFANIAESIEKVDAALAALVAGGLIYAYTQYSDLTSAVAELDKVLGDNSAGLEAAKQNAYDLSQQYGISMKDILSSTAEFAQAGFTVEEAMKLVKTSMDLTISGQIEAGKASEYLVQILKGFKAPAEDAARVVDILNETSNVYATDVNKLAEGMAKLSPIASLMGFSFEETAALLTPVIEVFQSGEEAADGLKTGLLKLADDSKPVTDALYALGVAQKTTNGELRPTKDILADIQAKFTTLTAEQKTFYTSQLVGLEQTPRMIEVFNGGAKSAEVLATALKAAGSASEEVAKQLATPEKQIAILKTSFQNLAEAIGEQYGKSATQVISSSNEIILALQKALGEGAFAAILSSLDSFLTDFSEYIKEVAKALPDALKQVDFSEFMTSLSELGVDIGDLFKKMFGSFDLTQPEDLAKALQKIVDAGNKLVVFSEGIAEGLKPFAEQMGTWVNKAIAADNETVKLGGSTSGFGQGINTLVKTLNILGPALGVFTGAVFIDAIANVGKMVLALAGLANPGVLAAAALIGTAAAVTALDKDGKEAVKQMNALGGSFENLNDSIYQAGTPVDTFKNKLNEIPEYKSLMFETDMDSAINQIQGLNDNIFSFGEGVSIPFGIDSDNADLTLDQLLAKIDAFPEQTAVEFIANSKELDAKYEEIMGGPSERIFDLTINAEIQNEDSINRFLSDVSQIEPATVYMHMDERSVNETKDVFKSIVNPDGTTTWVDVAVQPGAVEKAKNELKEIPTEKMLEIKLQGEIDKDITRIKASADTVQKAMEWTAKVNIAEIESSTKMMETMFGSLNTGIQATSSEISKLLIADWDNMGISQLMALQEEIRQTQSQKEKEFKLQEQLIRAQIDLMKTRNSMMKDGKGLIRIDSTGLEPALETIMWQILQKVQIKANEDSASFLLGIN